MTDGDPVRLYRPLVGVAKVTDVRSGSCYISTRPTNQEDHPMTDTPSGALTVPTYTELADMLADHVTDWGGCPNSLPGCDCSDARAKRMLAKLDAAGNPEPVKSGINLTALRIDKLADLPVCDVPTCPDGRAVADRTRWAIGNVHVHLPISRTPIYVRSDGVASDEGLAALLDEMRNAAVVTGPAERTERHRVFSRDAGEMRRELVAYADAHGLVAGPGHELSGEWDAHGRLVDVRVMPVTGFQVARAACLAAASDPSIGGDPTPPCSAFTPAGKVRATPLGRDGWPAGPDVDLGDGHPIDEPWHGRTPYQRPTDGLPTTRPLPLALRDTVVSGLAAFARWAGR